MARRAVLCGPAVCLVPDEEGAGGEAGPRCQGDWVGGQDDGCISGAVLGDAAGGIGEGVCGLVLGGGADVCVHEGAGVGEQGRAGVCAAGAGCEVASSTGSSCGIRVLAGDDCSTNVQECGEGGEQGPRGTADGLGNDVLRDGISGAVLQQVLYAAGDERDVGDVGVDAVGGGICLGAGSVEVAFRLATRVRFLRAGEVEY